jgi:RND family efflux transporter MFP subunit
VDDAEANLSDTQLRAPFAARIGETFVENFQDVRPKEPILSLIDVDAVDIKVDVPEGRMARFKGNTGRMVARFDTAPGREFELTVKEVATQADPATHTFRITLTMPQPEGLNLLPGMTATTIRYAPEREAGDEIVIPAIAIFADESGASHVWVVDRDANTVHRRPVATGELRGTDDIAIVEGLEPGEMIAVSAVAQLREGMAIRPIDEVRSR